MSTLDCTTCQEWIELEADGALPAADRRRLDDHVAVCTDCRTERRLAARLIETLAAGRVAVDGDLRRRVMAALPAVGWEAKSPRAWRLPMALFVLLAAGAAALAGLGSARLEPGLPFTSALVAVADLAATALLAGSGLLAASWTGVGAAVGELVGGSTGNLVAFVVLVAGIDLLLLSLLRRRPRLAESGARPLAEPTARRPRREG